MKYDEIPAVRRSALWEIRKSPAHYKYAVEHPKEPTPALTFGIAAHKYILEPDDFWKEYIELPKLDRRTKAGKESYQKILDSGLAPISTEDLNMIEDMRSAIEAHPTASKLLLSGDHEVPIQWTDPDTGEACKCRLDCITTYGGQEYIVDYKTTASCEDGAFERSCYKYGYKLQAAMYTEGAFNSRLVPYRFAFVAQEKTPHDAVRVYFCDDGFLEEGMEIYRELMDIYHRCRVFDEWPGYEDEELFGDERR
jgi:hypothetical protein